VRSLIIQTGGDLQAVDGVYPVEVSGYISRLVRLNSADKVPGYIERPQLFEFADGFLNDIFTKITHSGVKSRSNGTYRLAFAYGQNSDVRIGKISAKLRNPDAFPYFCNVVRDLSHALT
jgi:hypothetical protein